MTVVLDKRWDVSLEAFYRVAWAGENVRISDAAMRCITEAVVHMLDGGPLPPIAAAGQGGAGEILALYPLFADLSRAFDLQVKERGSLINGSPCAAALVADAALSSRRRLQLVLQTFALSIEAFRAPLEHYDAALELLWGDPDETAVLQAL